MRKAFKKSPIVFNENIDSDSSKWIKFKSNSYFEDPGAMLDMSNYDIRQITADIRSYIPDLETFSDDDVFYNYILNSDNMADRILLEVNLKVFEHLKNVVNNLFNWNKQYGNYDFKAKDTSTMHTKYKKLMEFVIIQWFLICTKQ